MSALITLIEDVLKDLKESTLDIKNYAELAEHLERQDGYPCSEEDIAKAIEVIRRIERAYTEDWIEGIVQHGVGTRREAELIMEDDDLLLWDHYGRYGFESPEEGVRQWEVASEFADLVAQMGRTESSSLFNEATEMLAYDCVVRGERLLKRARRRLEEAKTE